MTHDPPELTSVIVRSQQELLSPYQFSALCEEVRRTTGQKKLYFGQPELQSVNVEEAIGIQEFRRFLDSLSRYILRLKSTDSYFCMYLRRELSSSGENPNFASQHSIKIEVSLVGKGAIGQVARLRINDCEELALKVFFDPTFVWQHGPWAEIPVGIYMKSRQVTRNMAEFRFASEDWAVWEWIDPLIKPDDRSSGIAYEEFAREEKLTPLNPLNISNYNPHGIRLDPGGIQKNYFGRRFIDTYQSLVYYVRRFRQEGWTFLTLYLNRKTLSYLMLRWLIFLFPCFRRSPKSGSNIEPNSPRNDKSQPPNLTNRK